ncbi:hypothetical protein KFU94_68810 [Chloroflexi bacterium TSY]|nr:hypothetical protein [Chloroflexi bacterium TSY]
MPLLQTKLYIPPLRPQLVAWPRLINRLNQGLAQGNKLTLISAPAGFGKSTLLTEWIHNITASPLDSPSLRDHEQVSAWLSLDEGDNDYIRFLSYLIAALQTIWDAVGQDIIVALRSVETPPIESLLVELLNELTSISTPFMLILDDYQVIENDTIDQALI